ncbi:hypothetical protein B0H14DRAFT_3442554 [Mycena olivaceomarginata]|nr:hypothetical protein B0H14DRAFT_3442554 [Mycena olivaceomarginata]
MEEGEEESAEAAADQKKLLARLEELSQQTTQILQEQERIRKFLGVESESEGNSKGRVEEVGCKADKACVQCRQEGKS